MRTPCSASSPALPTPSASRARARHSSSYRCTSSTASGPRSARRRSGRFARWLRRWASRTADFNQNLIALGDFNIDRQGEPNYEAFTGEGLTPAPEHAGLPRTLPTLRGGKFYDQISWFTQGGRRKLTLGYEGSGGNFEFDRYVLRRMERVPLSYRISDHYPLWVEFLVPPPG